MAQILVVDDDTRLRDLLVQYLQGEGYSVEAAENANVARGLLRKRPFDLLVMDVMMPGEDGLTLTRALRQDSKVPILMLTAKAEAEDRIAGLESGADDYLTKPFEPRELCLRIERILQRHGAPQKTAKFSEFGPFKYDVDTGDLWQEGVLIMLSSAESRLLTVLAKHMDEPLTRDRLSAECNGISERSIDVQITRLRKKLEPDPKQPVYLQTHRGQGYVLRKR